MHVTVRTITGALVILSLATFIALAQHQPSVANATQKPISSIRGRVTDYRSGEPLFSAPVMIVGTIRGAVSDKSGLYRINAVPPGVYRLRCSYVGYEPAQKDSVLVIDSLETTVDFVLRTDCDTYADSAMADIQRGKIRIRVSEEQRHMLSASDEELSRLSRKYGFEYELSEYGPWYPCDRDSYNEVVNKYLERRNGKDWWSRFDKDYISRGYH